MLKFHYDLDTQFLNTAVELDTPFVMMMWNYIKPWYGKKYNSLCELPLVDVVLSEYKIEYRLHSWYTDNWLHIIVNRGNILNI